MLLIENWPSFISYAPPLIPPLPLAVNVPTSTYWAPLKSSPDTEKTYVPFRLLLLKLPEGGATGLVMPEPFPPQPVRAAKAKRMADVTRKRRSDITTPMARVLIERAFLKFRLHVCDAVVSTRTSGISSGSNRGSARFLQLFTIVQNVGWAFRNALPLRALPSCSVSRDRVRGRCLYR